MWGWYAARVASQTLLIPITVELESHDAMRVRKNQELFKQMGFGISEFGGDSFVVDALPTCFSGAAPTGTATRASGS